MNDHADLIAELRGVFVCPSPQRDIMNRAADALSSQSLSLSEARDRLAKAYEAKHRCNEDANYERRARLAAEAEIERLEGLVAGIRECPQEPSSVEKFRAAERQRDEALEALRPFGALADSYFHRYETRPGVFRESHQDDPDDRAVYGINHVEITTGHFRRARSALANSKSEDV